MDTPDEIAKMLKVKWDLGLNGGVLITNPIPYDASLDENLMNEAINKALDEAKEKQIKGKDITPYLLASIKNITKGKSLESNIQLVYNNCLLAAKIAKAYQTNDEV